MLMKISKERLKELIRESWAVSWPMTIIMFFEFLMGLADVYVAGRISKEIQAAYGVAFQIYFICLIPAMALTAGTVSIVSRLFTSPDDSNKKRLGESIFSTLITALIMGAAVSIVAILLRNVIVAALKVPQVIKYDTSLLAGIYSFGFIFDYFLITSNGVLRSCGKVRVSLQNYAIMCVMNIILNFFLAFKTPLGFRGIAVATVVSVATAAILNFFYVRKLSWQKKFNFAALKSMFNIGWPIGVLQILWNLAIIVIYFILANLPKNSVEAIAAFTNGLKLDLVVLLPAFAFNLANAVVVGNLLGKNKKDEAFNAGLITAFLGVGIIGLMSGGLILNAHHVMPFLSNNTNVIAAGLSYVYIILLFEPVMAWGVILGGALVGAGYTKNVLFSVILGAWIVRAPLCYFMAIVWHQGAIGVWWAINISVIIQSAYLSWSYFKKMRPVPLAVVVE